jgi:propanol-preferring alcohol dehydrogenase
MNTISGEEKEIKSVTNITRKDTEDFLPLAAQIAILPQVEEFSLEESWQGAAVFKTAQVNSTAPLSVS